MYTLSNSNMDEFMAKVFPAASSYSEVKLSENSKGILFDKQENKVIIGSPFFGVEIGNIDIQIDVPPVTPFFDVVEKKWTKPNDIALDLQNNFKDIISNANFIGYTSYYANNIINMLSKQVKPLAEFKCRYIFNQGYIPEGCMCVTFKMIGGDPIFELRGTNLKFVISDYSRIPKDKIQEGTYICAIDNQGDTVVLDVLSKYGKTRSGLNISEIYFDGSKLEAVNGMMEIPPELMVCSNVLEVREFNNDGEPLSMPPIHLGALLLYDLLHLFTLCRTGKFNLYFKEKTDEPVFLESQSQHPDDPKINIYMSCIRLDGRIQEG